MTSRMLKQSDSVKLLHNCLASQRNVLLKSASPALIHAIYDCIFNIIQQKIPITAKQERSLAKKKNALRALSNSRTKTPRKNKLFNSTRWRDIKNYSGHGVEHYCVIMSIASGKKFLVIPSDAYDIYQKAIQRAINVRKMN